MKNVSLSLIAACTMSILAPSAFADTLQGSAFGTGNSYTTSLSGATATFTSAPRNFSFKTQDGLTGVGIAGGRTNGEIDLDETITGVFSAPLLITNIRLGLLFDGPEYSDVNEVAQITATFADNSSHRYTLTATGANTATWTGLGSVSSVGSGAVNGGTGAWDLENPFGSNRVTGLSFTALYSSHGCAGCGNQSDYNLISISAVPEPETYAMLLAGLGLMGFSGKRRSRRSV
jgi:hypothetical protein